VSTEGFLFHILNFILSRQQLDLKQIFRSMRYGCMSAAFIMDYVLPNQYIEEDKELQVFLCDLSDRIANRLIRIFFDTERLCSNEFSVQRHALIDNQTQISKSFSNLALNIAAPNVGLRSCQSTRI